MAFSALILTLCFAVFFVKSVDSACTQHDIRLSNGPNAREGRVEYCYNNQWGTVCDDWFGTNDAKVVCSQLNYDANGAVAFRNARYGAGTGPIVLDDLRCTGNEINLRACPRRGFNQHNCNHNEDAGVRCPPCIDGSVWLPGGTTWREGTIEVCYNGTWSTVCDDQWGLNDARVICKMLDYDTNGVQGFQNAYFGQRYGPIIFDNVQCSGSEANIFQCNSNALGVHNCGHSEDAGVRCPACTKGSIRLWSAYNNTPAGEGMLHYCHNSGEWKAMCKYQWGCRDAKVACRNLGYNGSLAINALYDVEGAYGYYKPVLPQRVTCDGSETVLKSCSFQYTTWCDSPVSETAGVRCTEVVAGHGCTAGDLRLQNGNEPGEGRLEFCFHDEWSPFCQMDDEEGMVACKQLGYTTYPWAAMYYDERFGSSGYVSDFQKITCSPTASENHMINCSINYSPGCSVYGCWREWGIKCFNPGMCTDGQIRLVDGDIEQEGRIEFCYKGVWSTICGHYWNLIDSYTVCRQLNYTAPKAPTAYWGSYFGDGIYPIVWDFVQCSGWEKSFLNCQRKEYLQFVCGRGGIMSTRCYDDCTDGQLRLVNGNDAAEGTVEVCQDYLWGVIDEAGWSDADAAVVCRQLGFTNKAATSLYGSYFGRPKKTVHYTNVYCTGAEDTILECTFTQVSLNDGKTLYKNASAVGVDCNPSAPTPPPCVDFNSIGFTFPDVPDCTDNSVRLQGGNSSSGRVEVCFNGTWTPLCRLDPFTATLICKDLGFNLYSWAAIGNDGLYGTLANYSFVDNITCSSGSNSLSSCTLTTADCIPNCPLSNVWISCFNPGECTGNSIRLVDGYVANEGRVELCVNGVWGSVCGDGWDATDAHIACIQLGHPELKPIVFHNSYFGAGSRPIVYSNMACIGFENTTVTCSKQVYPSFTCSRDNVAGVLCGADCANGDIRLMGGSSNTEGTVEVCFDNVWGNVAESGWGEKDAGLVCSLLGFLSDGALPYFGSYFGKTAATALISDLYCTGNETSLLECTMTRHSVIDGRDLLNNIHVAGVQCMTINTCVPPSNVTGKQCTTGDVQVTGGLDNGQEGNLDYCYNGNWSPFCTLDRNTATVACRQLHFSEFSWAAIIGDGRYSPPGNTSSFQNITCLGGETSLQNCVIYDKCMSSCPIPYGIRCYEPGTCTEGDARLVGGYIAQEGRVEICTGGVWSGVCADSEWGKADALVVCNQLGLGVAEPDIFSYSSVYGEPNGPIIYSNLSCNGYETSLSQCQKNVYPAVQCTRNQIAGVLCRDICNDGDIKLMGSNNANEGTVVICRNSIWGLIAQKSWDDNDAIVTCRQLNYPNSGAMAKINSLYGKPNLTLQSSSIICSGSEQKLTDCGVSWLSLSDGKIAVSHVNVAGVYCTPNTPPPGCQLAPDYSSPVCTSGNVRLYGGPTSSEGLLQYCYKGLWSGFCSVDANIASVACKQLQFTQYNWASLVLNGQYGSGMGYSLFDSVTCTGGESTLSDCNISPPGQCLTKCTPNIGIKCYNPGICNEGTIRLADGAFTQQGRVEICTNGVWGTICDNGWDNADAYILCKGLGYGGSASRAYGGSRFGAGTGPSIYSNLQCGGSESSITQCAKYTYPSFICSVDQVASALCTVSCTDGSVRLVGGSNQYEGTVEICYSGLWGMIGSLNWGASEAQVTCYQLGFGLTGSQALADSPFGRQNDTVHLTNVGCSGSETELGDCTATRLDINNAQQYQSVAGVRCITNRTSVIVSTTSISSSTVNTTIPTPTTAFLGGPDDSTAIAAAAAILGVLTLVLIGLAIVIGLGMIYVQYKRRDASRRLSKKQFAEKSSDPREVVNPLATETGLDDENDEDTKRLHELIKESQLQ